MMDDVNFEFMLFNNFIGILILENMFISVFVIFFVLKECIGIVFGYLVVKLIKVNIYLFFLLVIG